MTISYTWRGDFANAELNHLHAEAFDHRVFDEAEWDWNELLGRHSLGWVTARDEGALVGFVNVPWDGFVHAWIQDTIVASSSRRRGVGTKLVHIARDEARRSGCEWLHVDFDADLDSFYVGSCGFTATPAGLIALQ